MGYDYRKFSFTDNRVMIFRTIESYTRTASGASWHKKPDSVSNEIVSCEHYTNYITAIPFFNSFGFGAYCRAAWNYTGYGYLPTTVTSVSPGKEKKEVATFWFYPLDEMKTAAGWREKEILQKANRFSIEYVDGSKMIHFFTDDDGVTAAGIYDTRRHEWRG